MIHLYTGEGKGKTTAAVGLAVRAAGNGFGVIFAQFMKGNPSGELTILESLPQVKILRNEINFGFYKNMSEEDKQKLTKIHNEILEQLISLVAEGNVKMVVLDEITHAVKYHLIEVEQLKKLLAAPEVEFVLTGRDAADFLVEICDYVTEMKCERHPYQKGIPARRGIEY